MVSGSDGFLTRMVSPSVLPAWLSDADLDFYAGEFARTGFRGGLNWYRNIDRNWELLAPFAGAKVNVPALYMAGDRDLVVAFRNMDKAIANLAQTCRSCAARSCCRAVGIGPSRSAPPRSTPP
jgi:pimeloyl-ACP methyl ester carboxylesterase